MVRRFLADWLISYATLPVGVTNEWTGQNPATFLVGHNTVPMNGQIEWVGEPVDSSHAAESIDLHALA